MQVGKISITVKVSGSVALHSSFHFGDSIDTCLLNKRYWNKRFRYKIYFTAIYHRIPFITPPCFPLSSKGISEMYVPSAKWLGDGEKKKLKKNRDTYKSFFHLLYETFCKVQLKNKFDWVKKFQKKIKIATIGLQTAGSTFSFRIHLYQLCSHPAFYFDKISSLFHANVLQISRHVNQKILCQILFWILDACFVGLDVRTRYDAEKKKSLFIFSFQEDTWRFLLLTDLFKIVHNFINLFRSLRDRKSVV